MPLACRMISLFFLAAGESRNIFLWRIIYSYIYKDIYIKIILRWLFYYITIATIKNTSMEKVKEKAITRSRSNWRSNPPFSRQVSSIHSSHIPTLPLIHRQYSERSTYQIDSTRPFIYHLSRKRKISLTCPTFSYFQRAHLPLSYYSKTKQCGKNRDSRKQIGWTRDEPSRVMGRDVRSWSLWSRPTETRHFHEQSRHKLSHLSCRERDIAKEQGFTR